MGKKNVKCQFWDSMIKWKPGQVAARYTESAPPLLHRYTCFVNSPYHMTYLTAHLKKKTVTFFVFPNKQCQFVTIHMDIHFNKTSVNPCKSSLSNIFICLETWILQVSFKKLYKQNRKYINSRNRCTIIKLYYLSFDEWFW